jgi:hypothetical protein
VEPFHEKEYIPDMLKFTAPEKQPGRVLFNSLVFAALTHWADISFTLTRPVDPYW